MPINSSGSTTKAGSGYIIPIGTPIEKSGCLTAGKGVGGG